MICLFLLAFCRLCVCEFRKKCTIIPPHVSDMMDMGLPMQPMQTPDHPQEDVEISSHSWNKEEPIVIPLSSRKWILVCKIGPGYKCVPKNPGYLICVFGIRSFARSTTAYLLGKNHGNTNCQPVLPRRSRRICPVAR